MTSAARSRPSTATSRRGGGACRSRSGAGLPETVVNALTVDVEEYYHGYEFEAALGIDGLRRLPSRVAGQTEHLLDLLDAHRARGTFFTLGVVAQRQPRLVRSIVERGHEIASHGWDHTPVYRLGPAGFRADVRRAKHAVEQAAGRLVRGYRAPNYSIRRDTPWAFGVLVEEGFIYDSSMYPVVHDRYGFPDGPRFPHVAQNVEGIDFWEVPVGTARCAGVNLPLGGGFFRLCHEAARLGASHLAAPLVSHHAVAIVAGTGGGDPPARRGWLASRAAVVETVPGGRWRRALSGRPADALGALDRLVRWVATGFAPDVIHLEGALLAPLARAAAAPTVLACHESATLRARDVRRAGSSAWRRLAARLDERVETTWAHTWFGAATACVAESEDERRALADHVALARVEVIPAGLDDVKHAYRRCGRPRPLVL